MSSTGVEIILTTTKGRGLQTTKKFETGQLIMKQQPYAYVIMEDYVDKVCHCCLATPGEVLRYSQ